jgi:flagellar protein FliS
MTASQEELRLMLYEGAIKFIRQGREGLTKDDYETSFNGLMRAQKIVLELSTSLNHDISPDLCTKLSALYTYIYRLLIDANVNHDTAKCDEAIKLLEYEKETWQMLMQKLGDEKGSQPAGGQGAQQTAMSSLSTSA